MQNDKIIRKFKAFYIDSTGKTITSGCFVGKKPIFAAHKVFTKINIDDDNSTAPIVFGLYETGPNSKNKIYWYTGKKQQLQNVVNLYTLPSTNENNKRYYTAKKIKQLGGFIALYGKPQYEKEIPNDKNEKDSLEKSYVLPSITYKSKNIIKKIHAYKNPNLYKI